ncbi:MAG: NADP-dependent malic enzyme [Oscillospiraceae bacterium]|jgi:malate dehydrogenase (oxaloacetate-decarboxylating)|nr:NADP-dependent malic enzyme [Oscillospiraceae bacterium]
MQPDTLRAAALQSHARWRGKIEMAGRAPVATAADLALAYTPGVAEPCKAIAANPEDAYLYTRKWNTVAVVSDGTAVLGLGDIGPLAGLPVMEGKALLFKAFADVDAFPLMLDTKDVDEIVETVCRVAPGLGGVNLEDIAAPRCFQVEQRLQALLDIPVFHDDQHGTAVVVAAALLGALRLTGRGMTGLRVVVNGVGAAGTACAKLLLSMGVTDLIAVDRAGIITGAPEDIHRDLALRTNPRHITGGLAEALAGADVFVGVSAPGALTGDLVRRMAPDSIIFAMANPTPEIFPAEALAAGARVVGTGRSDFPNQVNNVLAFPGIFRGALDCRARRVSEGMKLAAARAIAALVADDDLCETHILPAALDARVSAAVARAVAQTAKDEGLARL